MNQVDHLPDFQRKLPMQGDKQTMILLKNNLEDLIRHLNTTFTTDERKVDEALRSPFFADLEEIGGAYEMKTRKRTVQIKRPYQCGIAVYQLAKLQCWSFTTTFSTST